MKNIVKTNDKKPKRKPFILTENVGDVDEEWKLPISSPLKPAVAISNTTAFHFVPFECVV